ncbi:hypothetical protein Tco_0322958 [Tanacetum coccineum]
MGLTIKKRRRQRDADDEGSKALTKVLRKDHDAAHAEHNARGGKSLVEMSVDTELVIHAQETQDPPVATQIVNNPDPLSYAKPRSQQDVTQSSKEKGVAGTQDFKRSTPSPPITGSPGSIYQPRWGVPNSCRLDTPKACQDVVDHIAPSEYFSELRQLPNDEFLSQYNINLVRQVAMGSQLRLRFEKEVKLLKKSVAQVVGRDQRIATREKRIKELRTQVSRRKKGSSHALRSSRSMRLSGKMLSSRNVSTVMDTQSVDFDEDRYPEHVTAIARVVGQGYEVEGLNMAWNMGKLVGVDILERNDP